VVIWAVLYVSDHIKDVQVFAFHHAAMVAQVAEISSIHRLIALLKNLTIAGVTNGLANLEVQNTATPLE
jgi:hypothetical protein